MNTPSADCCADPEQKLLGIEEARQRIVDAVTAIKEVEQLPLLSALGRVLAENVVAITDVPSFANSAMDGYAVRSADCPHTSQVSLSVVGSSFAGAPYDGGVATGQCVRIMTGAVLPQGADAVLMQEHVRRDGEQISFQAKNVKPGLNVRYAGEDTRAGETVLQAGIRLGAAEIGLLASVGVGDVPVTRLVRAAFFSTGDELRSVGEALEIGQIYDSNRYALFGMLSSCGVECIDLGVIGDQREAIRGALQQASQQADVVITSGGVSVGEADYVKEMLEELGEITFWRMAMKPGKPLAFGRLNEAIFFGLPGNPVSTMVTFYQFVLPALRRMSGAQERPPLLIQARCSGALKKTPGRAEFQRGILQRDAGGLWTVSTTGLQGSHMLSSMSKANCFIILEANSAGAAAGDWVSVQPFLDFY